MSEDKVWETPHTAKIRLCIIKTLAPVAEVHFIDKSEKKAVTIPAAFSDHLARRRYSVHTVRNYSHHVQLFLNHVGATDCTDQDILGYITAISKREGVSTSFQNMAINAITFYVSSVLGRAIPKMNIRPKREKTLPVVLSEQEVTTLLKAVTNLKHRCILSLIYSAGLRLSEAVNIQINDIDFDRGILNIRQGKGKKDRQAPLSRKIADLLSVYRTQYHPAVYLFEGQDGGKYSKRSIQEILGHASSKTTEIYTHVSTKTIGSVRSPFDDMEL